ncbi:glycine zipper domain-containing protein [Caballeronia sp. DA-9]|uniref:glycine zipper domain-containing protein n=1 Tax=Caballeronia sp. DA-9 TaxID=3436237 RepID=UPI003F6625F8
MSTGEYLLPKRVLRFPAIQRKPRRLAALLVFVALLDACQSTNQTVGTLSGAGVGAGVGKIFGGNTGALVGGALGAVIGNLIGRQLDARDQARLEEAKRTAQATNQTARFYANSAKSEVVVQPKTYVVSRPALLLADDVGLTPLTVIPPKTTYLAVDTPVYRRPFDGEAPKMVIEKGTPLTAIATVDGAAWQLVGRGDYGIGYVPERYLRERSATARNTQAPAASAARKSSPASSRQAKPTPSGPTTNDLLSANADYTPPPGAAPVVKATQADYERASYQGQARAIAVKSAQAGTGSRQLTNANVVCHDLTTTLLSDHSTETSEQCGNDPPTLRK